MESVYQYDWKNNLKWNLVMLKIIGLWPNGAYKINFYTIFAIFLAFLFCFCHVLAQVIKIFFVADDFKLLIGTIYIILTEFMAMCKIYNVTKNMDILKQQIVLLNSDWFQPRNLNQLKIIEPSIAFWRNVYKVLLVLCFACNAFWMVFPMLDKSDGEKRLPFLAWFPFNFTESPFYEIAYVFQVVSTCYLTIIHLNVDTLISGFNVYVRCQFDMLCDNLRNLGNSSSFDNNNTKNFNQIKTNLIRCVFHHRQILSFVKGFKQFSSWILFWHLIISGVSIGITMFQLTLVVPLSNEFYSLLSFGSAIIVQIFMYCWFGNEVQVRSDLLAYAVFESNWTDFPENIKKDLWFFNANVIEPMTISAFNIFHVSVETFMRILKTAWSYFALLYQLGSRN